MDRLAEILADMVRSALAWEQENGPPPRHAKINPPEPLIKNDGTFILNQHEKTDRGTNYEHKNNNPEFPT